MTGRLIKPRVLVFHPKRGRKLRTHPWDTSKPIVISFRKGAHETIESLFFDHEASPCYSFTAKSGQTFELTKLSDLYNTVVFTIYLPGYTLSKPYMAGMHSQYNDFTPIGPGLDGHDAGDPVRSLRTTLPKSGRYLMCLQTHALEFPDEDGVAERDPKVVFKVSISP